MYGSNCDRRRRNLQFARQARTYNSSLSWLACQAVLRQQGGFLQDFPWAFPGVPWCFCLQQLHPCIETLNSRNLGLAQDSFKVSFGFRTLWRPRLIKDPKNVKSQWFYCVFAQKCKKNNWFYCVFAQKCKTNQWFYCVFAQKC